MFALLLLYIIPLIIQESYSYFFLEKFEYHETDCCKIFRAFFKRQKHSKWFNHSTFQNLNSKFHCGVTRYKQEPGSTASWEGSLRSQWSALPVNPSWVPGSCFRWSQRLATLAIRGVMPFSGLFEHCTQSQTHIQPRIRKILEICTYSSCQTLTENIPPPLPCTQAPGSETQTGQKNSLYP